MIASKIGSAAATRNPKAALAATPDWNKFATSGEGIRVVQKGGELQRRDSSIILEFKYKYDYIYYLMVNIITNIIITKYVIIT